MSFQKLVFRIWNLFVRKKTKGWCQKFYFFPKQIMIIWIILGLLVIVGIYGVSLYNRLVSLKNHRDNAFADIDVQLTNRFDLVENLVETVKGYAVHEKETLQGVIQARASFMSAQGVDDKLAASNQLTGALKSLFAVSESYPDLKANQNFLQLQTELSDLENKLAASRRFFNSTTKEFNVAIEVFPSNLIAKQFWFEKAAFFELENEEAKQAPKVKF